MNLELQLIERSWRQSQRLTAHQLMEMFPGAEEIILQQLSFYKTRKTLLEARKLARRNALKGKCKDEFSVWVMDYVIEQDIGLELKEVNRHMLRLKNYLNVLHPSLSNPKMLSDDQIVTAKTVPIESLLSQPLRKSGDRLYSACPLHNEKTPSFVVYKNTNTAWCFGCQQGGDTIKLTQLLHDYSFREAVNYLNHN